MSISRHRARPRHASLGQQTGMSKQQSFSQIRSKHTLHVDQRTPRSVRLHPPSNRVRTKCSPLPNVVLCTPHNPLTFLLKTRARRLARPLPRRRRSRRLARRLHPGPSIPHRDHPRRPHPPSLAYNRRSRLDRWVRPNGICVRAVDRWSGRVESGHRSFTANVRINVLA